MVLLVAVLVGLIGAIGVLNVWHIRDLSTLTPKEREDDDAGLECDLQNW
jgi:hypothetical protein